MDSFYHTVLSDASHQYFADNTITNFRNYCSPSISLEDDIYEVALVKCSFVYSDPVIKQGQTLLSVVESKHKRSTMFIPSEMDMSSEALPWLNRNYRKKSKYKEAPIAPPEVNPQQENVKIITNNNPTLSNPPKQNPIPKPITTPKSEPPKTLSKIVETAVTKQVILPTITETAINIPTIVAAPTVQNTAIPQTSTSTFEEGDHVIDLPPATITPEILEFINTHYEPINRNSTIYSKQNCYSIQDLINEIQTQLADTTFSMNEVLTFSTPNQVKFDSRIGAILGFSEYKMVHHGDKYNYTAQFKPYFKHGQTEMFIYSDLIKPQAMGDGSAPLLATVVYSGEEGQRKSIEFQYPQYYDLVLPNIDSIHVYIRSESGEILPLTFGNFSAQLHFRRKRF